MTSQTVTRPEAGHTFRKGTKGLQTTSVPREPLGVWCATGKRQKYPMTSFAMPSRCWLPNNGQCAIARLVRKLRLTAHDEGVGRREYMRYYDREGISTAAQLISNNYGPCLKLYAFPKLPLKGKCSPYQHVILSEIAVL